MAKANNLCRGEHCPNRAQCSRYLRYITSTEAVPSISHCTDGKLFERDPKNVHPQHRR
jgi:hypothetical protein